MKRYLINSAAVHASLILALALLSLFRSGPELMLIDGFQYMGGGGGDGRSGSGGGAKAQELGQVVPNPVRAPLPPKAAPVKEATRAEDTWTVKDKKAPVTAEPKQPAVPETAPVADKEQKAQDNVIRRGKAADEQAGEGGFDFGTGRGPGSGGDGKGVGIGFGPGEGGGFGGYGSYLSVMRQRIWSEWSQSRVFGTKWVAVVALTVARDGEISAIKLEKSSGDNYYDQVAVRAVRNSSPLPPLPPTARDNQRFRIQFKLMD